MKEDGYIKYVGRVDHQVKLCGFRIELGEIQPTLASLKGVEACIVHLRENNPSLQQIVAYVVESGDGCIDDWRQHLSSELPSYIVPTAVVVLDSLPLTVNGKIDYNALPFPKDLFNSRAIIEHGPDEKTIAAIWNEDLQSNQNHPGDNFFAMGGNSLIPLKLLTRIRQKLNITVSILEFYSQPTLENLVMRAVEYKQSNKYESRLNEQ
jgi:aryl carrier-like protein